jgi:hypothetical protein
MAEKTLQRPIGIGLVQIYAECPLRELVGSGRGIKTTFKPVGSVIQGEAYPGAEKRVRKIGAMGAPAGGTFVDHGERKPFTRTAPSGAYIIPRPSF